jgi:hypothetical protein
MIEYLLKVKMADTTLPISEEMEKLIIDCTNIANSTTVSLRNKRTFTVEKRMDEFTLIIKLTSRDSINATRSLSTLSRAVSNNERMREILNGHIINGCVFNAKLLEEQNAQIKYASDPDIASEIISIFFDNTLLPKEKELARFTATEIRDIIIKYKNNKANLK